MSGPATEICNNGDSDIDYAALIRRGAKLGKYEGLSSKLRHEHPEISPPGSLLPVPLKLRPGDAVLLHPDTAHAAAPNLHPSNVRTMIYFRLRNARVYSREMCDRMRRAETVKQAWEDLPEVVKILGPEKKWSSAHRALVEEHQAAQKKNRRERS
eukprot:jgi/Bigna1/133845/aug1.22_g8553